MTSESEDERVRQEPGPDPNRKQEQEQDRGDRQPGGWARMSLRMARRVAVGVIGATVVLFGLVMVLTPGPAIIVIPVGLSILALEFAWARRLLARFHEQASRARESWSNRRR